MAVQFITEFNDIIFSSEFPDVILKTYEQKLKVSVRMLNKLVYNETLFAFEGTVSIHDLKSIIEMEMLTNYSSFSAVSISAYEESSSHTVNATAYVIFCDASIDHSFAYALDRSFLTPLKAKSLLRAKNARDYLYWFSKKAETNNVRVQINYQINDSEILSSSFVLGKFSAAENCIQSYCVDYNSLSSLVPSESFILSATVLIGNRAMTYYFSDDMPNIILLFFNAFNCYELAALNCITTTITKANRSVAMCNGINQFYNQSNEQSFEVQTAPLLYNVAQWLTQLAISPEVRLVQSYDKLAENNAKVLPVILLTEVESKVSNSNENLNSLKFTFQFAEPRPKININAVDANRIFTEEYNQSFV